MKLVVKPTNVYVLRQNKLSIFVVCSTKSENIYKWIYFGLSLSEIKMIKAY